MAITYLQHATATNITISGDGFIESIEVRVKAEGVQKMFRRWRVGAA